MSHHGDSELAAAFLRRSTDQQDRSLDDQRAAIESYAKAHNLRLAVFYVDDAISGTRSTGRNAFQQMMDDACARPRIFDVIIVYDITRFGRMDNDETGYYRHLLRLQGVRVLYAAEGFVDGSIDDLLRPVKQWVARQESKDLARVVIRGHVSKFASRGGGWWMCGVPPWGYDRRYEDVKGKFLFIVRNMRDHTKLVLNEHGEVIRALAGTQRLSLSDQDRCRLVPSEPGRVMLIRRIFHDYTENGMGCSAIAQRLNHESILPPRSGQWDPRCKHNRWTYAVVRMAITNPAYAGMIVWNRRTKGIFYRINKGVAVERPPHHSNKTRNNLPEDWLVCEGAHQPIVSPRIFRLAQELMAIREKACGRASPDYYRCESDFRARYVLTGLAGVLATLSLVVMLLAGSPNSSPEQLRMIKMMMIGSGVFGLIAVVGGFWLMAVGRPWTGLAVGASPIALVVGILVYVTVTTGR